MSIPSQVCNTEMAAPPPDASHPQSRHDWVYIMIHQQRSSTQYLYILTDKAAVSVVRIRMVEASKRRWIADIGPDLAI
jgi:hypothetical protein